MNPAKVTFRMPAAASPPVRAKMKLTVTRMRPTNRSLGNILADLISGGIGTLMSGKAVE